MFVGIFLDEIFFKYFYIRDLLRDFCLGEFCLHIFSTFLLSRFGGVRDVVVVVLINYSSMHFFHLKRNTSSQRFSLKYSFTFLISFFIAFKCFSLYHFFLCLYSVFFLLTDDLSKLWNHYQLCISTARKLLGKFGYIWNKYYQKYLFKTLVFHLNPNTRFIIIFW